MDSDNVAITEPLNSVLYPADNIVGLRSLSNIVHLIGCSILAYCFALRSHKESFFTIRGLQSITWPRWLVILVFFDSWLFIFLAGVLVNGIGMSLNVVTCQLGIFACIIFYALSKVFIYLFLIEKVYIVWPNRGQTRWSSIAYRVCITSMTGYAVILVVMILGRIAFRQQDGQCVIGLGKISSLSLLVYDLVLNLFLTGMFLYPLRQNKFMSRSLQRVARRTLAAATMALITSALNVAILTILHGQELGWVCLASCGTDTTINALVLFWVTSTGEDSSSGAAPSSGPTHPAHNLSASGPFPGAAGGSKLAVHTPVGSQHDSPGHQRMSHITAGRDNKMHVVLPNYGETPISETVTTISRNEMGRQRSLSRQTRNSVHRTGIVTRVMQVLGLQGDDRNDPETHSMSVQVTVTTQTDAIAVSDYKPPPTESVPSSSPPREVRLAQQQFPSHEIPGRVDEDLEQGSHWEQGDHHQHRE